MLLLFHFCLTEQQVYLKFIEFKVENLFIDLKKLKKQQSKYNMIFGQNLEHEKAVGYMKLEKKHIIYG